MAERDQSSKCSSESLRRVNVDDMNHIKVVILMADEAGHKPVNPPASSKSVPTSRPNQEPVRLMISGSRWGIKVMIHTLFKLGFAPVDAWSKPQTIPNSDQLMSVMTKYIRMSERAGESDIDPTANEKPGM